MKLNAKLLAVKLLFCFVCFVSAISVAWAQAGATVTKLSVSSNNVSSGTPVTMTASVTAAGAPVPAGLVLFCNANALRCQDSAIVGSAWVTKAGTASIRKTFGVGTFSIQAVFVGTKSNAASSSTAQSLTVANSSLSATTTLSSSGTAGNYTLSATVATTGAVGPTGSVSFVDSSNGNSVIASAALGAAAPSSSVATTAGPAATTYNQAIAVGDFNNDGKLDYVVANLSSTSTATIMLGNGDGTFTKSSTVSAGAYAESVVAADFNGDGNLDLAFANSAGKGVTVLLGNGDGTFTAAASPSLSYAVSITVGDFNGDGIPDLAVATNSGGYGVQILLGNGDGSFRTGVKVPVPQWSVSPEGIVAADFDGDGTTDLAVTSAYSYSPATYQVTILLGNGDGTFRTGQSYATGNVDLSLTAGDFNGDGVPDLAIANKADSTISLLLGNGDGTFRQAQTISLPAGSAPVAITAGDFNNGGKLDLFTANYSKNTVSILLGNGDGTFAASTTAPATGTSPSGIVLGDFNGDGLLDFVTANYKVSNPSTLLQSVTSNATALSSGVSAWGNGTHNVVATYSGDNNYPSSSSAATPLAGTPVATPVMSLPSGAFITGQSLTISDSTSGAVVYYTTDGSTPTTASTPYAGAITLSSSETLSAIAAIGTASSPVASITVTVSNGKTTPTLTWPAPAAITYGTALSATQLNASSGGIAGTFTYSPALGTVLGAGAQSLTVTFTPTDTADYNTATASVTLTVNKATPTVAWSIPAAITYGTALSATQLNATSGGVDGSFSYSPAAGTVLAAGSQTLSVSFTPTDVADYTPVTANVTLTVNKATPSLTWAAPAAITYGTALSTTQLNASSCGTDGIFAYSPAAGAVLGAGSQTLSVTFTPTDATDYNTATASVALTVNKATPMLTWATPAAIPYGTALSSTQLNASSGGIAGTFAYTPSAGTVLGAGPQTLTVSFTPTDAADYNTATASVTLTVNKATPTLTWATPAVINYGTALSSTQLNASSNGLAGSFVYSPAAGTVLGAGSQTLSVTFTPSDAADYNTTNASVTLTVNQAAPVISWATPAPITYGTALSSTQLNASSGGIAGTYSYTPAAGTVLSAGSQTLSVTFIPIDATNYSAATATVTLTVNKATPSITWATPAAINYGTALSSTQLNASSNGLAGSFVYSPAAGAVLGAGSQTLSATFTPADTTNYASTTATVILTVNRVPLTITASNQSKTYGQNLNLGTTAFSVAGLVNGDTVSSVTLSSTGAAGTASVSGSPYAIVPSAPFGPGFSATNYAITYVNGTLTVSPAPLTITANNQSKPYGQNLNLGTTAFTATGLANGETIGGVTLASTGAAATATLGSYTITASGATGGSFTAGNYTISYANGALTVTQATPTVSFTYSSAAVGNSKNYKVTFNVTVTAPYTQAPAGSVTITASGASACTISALTAGTSSSTGSCTATLSGGSYDLKVTYSGNTYFTSAVDEVNPFTVP